MSEFTLKRTVLRTQPSRRPCHGDFNPLGEVIVHISRLRQRCDQDWGLQAHGIKSCLRSECRLGFLIRGNGVLACWL
ncbi:hypothetical protein E2C01_093888 [Portunus trituberculatus]|uniref:Uncharacterized protein n=1 Tax=Portunus trituberculatus TaxID=210409 RepID=A0A5B7JVF6_PORTR|nr:hypothetical protein [Portunus trituberculatus]